MTTQTQACIICNTRPRKYATYCGPCFDAENVSIEEMEAVVGGLARLETQTLATESREWKPPIAFQIANDIADGADALADTIATRISEYVADLVQHHIYDTIMEAVPYIEFESLVEEAMEAISYPYPINDEDTERADAVERIRRSILEALQPIIHHASAYWLKNINTDTLEGQADKALTTWTDATVASATKDTIPAAAEAAP